MSCSWFASALLDLARGLPLDDGLERRVRDHLQGCAACAARLESELATTRALRAIATIDVPPAAPSAEAALLAAFDAHHAVRSARSGDARWLARAAAALFAAGAAALVHHAASQGKPSGVTSLASRALVPVGALPVNVAGSSRPPETRAASTGRSSTPPADAAFIAWPGAAPLPAFESGELMRVELPASVAVSLGLAPHGRASRVRADVLVGQDGYVRAVRLAP
jgi:hypothetical protein